VICFEKAFRRITFVLQNNQHSIQTPKKMLKKYCFFLLLYVLAILVIGRRHLYILEDSEHFTLL